MAASSSRINAIETESGYVVEPLGEHRATIVWLHDVHKDSSSSVEIVTSLNLRNIKWICLDSGTRIVPLPYTPEDGVLLNSWCDMGIITDTMQDFQDEFDSATVRVADILSTEPPNVIKGVGGVGQGAQVALLFAKWSALGNYTINMRVAIGINYGRIPNNRLYSAPGAVRRVSSQSILLTRGILDSRVHSEYAKETAGSLIDAGFGEVSFVQFPTLGREITLDVLNTVKVWLNGKLPLDPN